MTHSYTPVSSFYANTHIFVKRKGICIYAFISSMSTLGKRIKDSRKDAKLTQEKLGGAVGLDQTVISKLEKGETKETTKIGELSHALGVNAYWLATGKGKKVIGQTSENITLLPEAIFTEAIRLLAEMDEEDFKAKITELKCTAEILRAKTIAAVNKARHKREEEEKSQTKGRDSPKVQRRTA